MTGLWTHSIDRSTVMTFAQCWCHYTSDHIVLKTSPGAAIFGGDMLFDVPFLADWTKIVEYRQKQTDKNTVKENSGHVDWDYQPGDKVLVIKDGILRKSESRYDSEPWTITSDSWGE